jgi:flagellar motility protein MotE (MotC chaperone)
VPSAAAPAPPVRAAIAQADPVAKAAAYKQVARVLSAMKPVEAAKVLAYLSDEEVEGLLRAVGPRQAADFLTNIPKERAAGLSRRLLVPKGQSR